jgi:protein-S-isoprenylcysteine O-methyltransferase Ste14
MTKRLIIWSSGVSVITLLLFALSGRWTDPWLWSFVGLWAATTFYGLAGIDDELARERFRPPTKGADPVALRFVRVFALAHLVLGALDTGRWHLAPVDPALRAFSLVAMVLTFGAFFRAMHENRFFSAVVRVQSNRAHRVVDTGPYSVIRHPGYAGLLLAMPFSGLALGSFISAGIGVVLSALIVRRVMVEDAFLRQNLEGYTDYAARVPHRLVPGLW